MICFHDPADAPELAETVTPASSESMSRTGVRRMRNVASPDLLCGEEDARPIVAPLGFICNEWANHRMEKLRSATRGGPMTKPIPDGYHTLTPYLAVEDAAKAIDFYKQAFGATELMRMDAPGGKIGHAELKIGDSLVMISDPFPQSTVRPPVEVGGSTASIFMYVEDVDAAVKQAVDAGATVTMEVEDMFWGDRFGSVSDPFGHTWSIATHVEDLSPEEIAERGQVAMAAMTS